MPPIKRRILWAAGIGLALLSLAACNAGSDDGPPPPTVVKHYAYLIDPLSPSVIAFTIDPGTGVPTPSHTFSLASDLEPLSLAVTPSGRYAYVVGHNSRGVFAYSIDPATGAWNGVAGTPFSSGVQPSRIAVEPAGRYAYVASDQDGAIAVLRIDDGTGRLTPIAGSPFSAPCRPDELVIEPGGRYAYVICADTGAVSGFAIDGNTGALTGLGGSASVGTDPETLTVDPAGRRLYVANFGSKDISAFAIDAATGALTAVPGSPFPVPQPPPFMLFPWAIAIDPSGRAAFVACMGSMTLASFLIDESTGAMAPTGSGVTTWNSPVAISFGPTGRHIYVLHSSDPGTLSYYEIEPATGAIWLKDALTAGQFPSVLVVSRLSR